MKIGIIGTGLMSEIYADIILQDNLGTIEAVAGNTEEKTLSFAKKYNIKGYPNSQYDLMFESHNFDLVIIATPEWVREDPVKSCVNNNVHIILEKPFADSLQSATSLKDTLYGYKKGVKICHVLRYSERFYAAKNYLLDKKIIHMDSSRNSNLERFKRIEGKTNPAFWLAPHDIDMMIWLKDQKIKEVFAMSNKGRETESLLTTMMRFDDDTTATFRNIWGAKPVSNISKSAYFNIWHKEGCLEIDDSDMNIRVFDSNSSFQIDTYEDFHMNGKRYGFFRNMMDSIINSFINNSFDTKKEIDNAFDVTLVSEMISRSVKEKRIIKSEEI